MVLGRVPGWLNSVKSSASTAGPLTVEMDSVIRSLSTLDVKCLVMEGDELITGSDYGRYLKSVQENSTLMRYANDLTFLVNYVCVMSEMWLSFMGIWRRCCPHRTDADRA